MQQQQQVDINKTSAILTPSGGQIWKQGVLLRKVSKFITASQSDQIVPIAIFYDEVSGEICLDGLPQEVINIIQKPNNESQIEKV